MLESSGLKGTAEIGPGERGNQHCQYLRGQRQCDLSGCNQWPLRGDDFTNNYILYKCIIVYDYHMSVCLYVIHGMHALMHVMYALMH